MKIGQIISRESINKGWSGDKKYRITVSNGTDYLFRVSPADRFERRKTAFERMLKADELGIPMCRPIEFGLCDEGVYSIQSWIDGSDADSIMPHLSDRQQYAYGLDAGQILARIHTIPAPKDIPDWETRFNAKIDRKIAMYSECPLKYDNGEHFLRYISENRHLLANRPQSYQHGDYHIGNMMIDKNDRLVIIDFDRDDYGDPWEEFNRIVWCTCDTPLFASGIVDGYFEKNVPDEFWRLLALYICSNTLSSLPWAIPFGQSEIETMRRQAADVLKWYDMMRSFIPSWYKSL